MASEGAICDLQLLDQDYSLLVERHARRGVRTREIRYASQPRRLGIYYTPVVADKKLNSLGPFRSLLRSLLFKSFFRMQLLQERRRSIWVGRWRKSL